MTTSFRKLKKPSANLLLFLIPLHHPVTVLDSSEANSTFEFSENACLRIIMASLA